MASHQLSHPHDTFIHVIGRSLLAAVESVGNLTLFAMQLAGWLGRGLPKRSVLLPAMYNIGVLSLPVVMITGGFIGMVLAVQAYDQFHLMHLGTRLGADINVSVVKELGPVLAATMLAGRAGRRMAADVRTLPVTRQIDPPPAVFIAGTAAFIPKKQLT